MSDLVEVIQHQQIVEGKSQQEFAEQLEVSAAYLSMLYHRKRKPNVKLLSRLRKLYPGMAGPIDLFLAKNFTLVTE